MSARNGAHIGPLAAFRRQDRMVGVRNVDEPEMMNFDRPCVELDHFPLARQVVGALAVDLDRREARRHLFDGAG